MIKLNHAEMVAKTHGFKKFEVPWIVNWRDTAITKPESIADVEVSCSDNEDNYRIDGVLIGSAEQGFLAIRHCLEKNKKYVATTPCFRDEPQYIPGYIEPYFMKTELFIANPEDPELAFQEVLLVAERIMGAFSRDIRRLETAEGIDLMLNGIEVGSYGIREHEDFRWVYGTGMAEPRFTYALEKK